MSQQTKLLTRVRNNPDGVSFRDFQLVMKQQGWMLDHQRGSHQVWCSPLLFRISVQNRNGKAKGYQVRQFLLRWEEENKYAQ